MSPTQSSCRHYTTAIEFDCRICAPAASYTIIEKQWENAPIVEVLRDGKPWLMPWDKEFQFGRIKTKMILSCINTIERFAVSLRPDVMLSTPVVEQPDPDLAIQLRTFPAFTNSYGVFVEEPFLRLDRIPRIKSGTHIGFGQHKAAALVILQEELEQWLVKVHGWYGG